MYSSQQHNLTAKELLFCFLYFFQAQLSRFPVDSGHLPSFLFLKTARVGFCCLQSKNPEQCRGTHGTEFSPNSPSGGALRPGDLECSRRPAIAMSQAVRATPKHQEPEGARSNNVDNGNPSSRGSGGGTCRLSNIARGSSGKRTKNCAIPPPIGKQKKSFITKLLNY